MPLGLHGLARPGEEIVAEPASAHLTLADLLEAIEFCFEQGWTDGLPVVPPTPERVQAFLGALELPPDTVVGALPEQERVITAEKLAINAVLAGCLPSYLPVLVAAVRAVTAPAFGLAAAWRDAAGVAPLLIVNGPVRRLIDLNAGAGLFGPGARANATIGRALSLLLRNTCDGRPDGTEATSFGHPGQFTYCIAEDEEGTNWEPLHVERGLSAETSAVTAVLAGAPHLVRTRPTGSPEEVLRPVADALSATAHYQGAHVVVLGPVHRAALERAGWSKADVRAFLAEHARRSVAALKEAGLLPGALTPGDAHRYPALLREADLVVVAAGGPGGADSVVVPPWAHVPTSQPVLCPVAVSAMTSTPGQDAPALATPDDSAARPSSAMADG